MQSDTVFKLEISANHRFLNVVGACVNAVLDRVENLQEAETIRYAIELAVHETCTNIVDHAYPHTAEGRIQITLQLAADNSQLIVELEDQGIPFNPASVTGPDLDTIQVRGYGLFLVHELADEVTYTPQAGRNHWRLVKHLS